MAEPSGKRARRDLPPAWRRGLKTTYYLRTLGATHVERSTVTDGALNAVSAPLAAATSRLACRAASAARRLGALDNPTCEACQSSARRIHVDDKRSSIAAPT